MARSDFDADRDFQIAQQTPTPGFTGKAEDQRSDESVGAIGLD